MEVNRDRAERKAAEAFQASGLHDDDAALVAEVLVTADASGKGSHGLLRLPRYVRGIEHGSINPEGTIETVRETNATVTIDGGSRPGPSVAATAMGIATDRADQHGIGAVGVQNSTHLGMLGYYTQKARSEGYIAIGMTNTEPAMPPYGGSNPILGTNPIAIGLPTDPPFNLDMSTSSIARGTLLRKKEAGETIPEGVALDSTGEPTNDPAAALEGTILPFGGPKGSGLAIAVEILAGGLVGAAMGRDVTGTYHTENECTKGDFFIVIDPVALGGEAFVDQASNFLTDLKNEKTATGIDAVRLPGERTIEREAVAQTITVEDEIWEKVCTRADELKQ